MIFSVTLFSFKKKQSYFDYPLSSMGKNLTLKFQMFPKDKKYKNYAKF